MAIKYLSNISLEGNEIQNVKLHPLASAPSGAEAQVYYDTADNKLYAHNGTAWYSINGQTESVATGDSNTISIGGTAAEVTISAVTAAVTNGSANLVTGDGVYDFVISQIGAIADANDYVDAATFNSVNGELTLSVGAQSDVVVDLDGRYLTDNSSDFATIEISGSTSVTASSVGDSFELDAGANMAISASGSVITFDATNDNDIDYISAATFDAGTGVITGTGVGNAGFTVDIDGRYLTDEADTLDSVTGRGATTTNNITVGDMTVGGNLIVSGTTTTVNTETINLADNIITLNSNEVGVPSEDGGIEIERGTSNNASLFWNEASDRWMQSDGSSDVNIPVTGEFNPTIGTDTDVSTGALTVIDSLTLTDGVITASNTRTIQTASATQQGVIEMATNTEAAAFTLTTRAITPANLGHVVNGKLLDVANHFSATVGNNIAATIQLDHNMGTRDVNVQVYDATTYETVFVETERSTVNRVLLHFASVPATDSYEVVISQHYR